MHRQKSILSFLQKPSSENYHAGGPVRNGGRPPHLDMKEALAGKPTSSGYLHDDGRPPHLAMKEFLAGKSTSRGYVHNDGRLPCLSVKETLNCKPTSSSTTNSSLEIRGTDTPPEKVPRQIFSSDLTPTDNKRPAVFSSIMHKFVKADERETPSGSPCRNQVDGDCSIFSPTFNKLNDCKEATKCGGAASINSQEIIISKPNKSNSDILGPETPGERPFVPRLKRIRDDCSKFDDRIDLSLTDSSKRLSFFQDSETGNKSQEEVSKSTRKFEWLDPSQIKDANGRRPEDALYDRRTLYIPPDAFKKMSPSQKQYWSVKCEYMDVILFFKVGKFYELYELDAEIGHKELDWKITNSGVGKCQQAGISESGIDDAVQKLVARGYKVGRMEQLETSEQAKARGANSVIPRKLVHVVTPSTTDENIGPDAVHLLAIKEGSSGFADGSIVFGFAFVDCASLKIWVGSVSDDTSCSALGALLMQVSPKEVIYESRGLSREAQKALKKYSPTGCTALQTTPVLPVNGFLDSREVKNMIEAKGYFKGSGNLWHHLLDSVTHHEFTLCALGGLINHLSRLMLDEVLCNGDILPYQVYKGCLRLDGQTLINLEIFGNNSDGGPAGTLFKFLDSCITSSGKRLLKSWICHPLKDVQQINYRLDVVGALMAHPGVMLLVAQQLHKVPDLERLFGRVKVAVQSSATLLLPVVGKKVMKQRVKAFGSLVKGLRVAMDLLVMLQKEHVISCLSKILELPVLSGHDGLDKFLTQFEAAIDSDFPKYQDHDATESDAETLAILIGLFVEKGIQWSQVIHAMTCIDVLRSFAITASDSSGVMSRPLILPPSATTPRCQNNKGPTFKIKGLWHPFALGENGVPVPNDLYLGEAADDYHCRTLLLTGPNMGGKSTLLRAACLAVILAQLGCYVPCDMCVLSLVDTIFTRLGATDRIIAGESTFYIECAETASVLQNATQDSLVLLDELGRGTSTFDGYAIAYAVLRHLVEKVNCRLLFATHYHPLTKEFASHPHVTLQHMACTFKQRSEASTTERDRELVFLYRLASGACPESYGLQVALMAGIPKQVVEAASEAGRSMKEMVGRSFLSSERRSEFSSLHEEWLKTLLAVSRIGESSSDDDAYDTLVCLWHELKQFYVKSVDSV
ncbi:hypothetical protein Nepgr_019866 [Nepenthes gracilis]|uniref:DNA mismatch repair proteins mutS family domain-containing protein n=1 Tax=Nepenthes gracilis TaxID=150966 RepID=A0AAD3SVR7_NEPGR|nr:hypothetical protein Nepgr_019866 [Nepenthes gracilis]